MILVFSVIVPHGTAWLVIKTFYREKDAEDFAKKVKGRVLKERRRLNKKSDIYK